MQDQNQIDVVDMALYRISEVQRKSALINQLPMYLGDQLAIMQLVKEAKQYQDIIGQCSDIIITLMAHLPDSVGTSDMNSCKSCGTTLSSGSILHCVKCTRKIARDLINIIRGNSDDKPNAK